MGPPYLVSSSSEKRPPHPISSPPPPKSKRLLHITYSKQADTEKEPGAGTLRSQPAQPDTFKLNWAVEQKEERGFLNRAFWYVYLYF